MDAGLVIDKGHANALGEQEWMEGAAERSFWTGLKTKGRERFKVITYRCERCGMLESYGTQHVDK